MILIADSGTTKTDWRMVSPDRPPTSILTKGMNPYFQTEDELGQALTDELLPVLPDSDIEAVYFYGAGCAFDKIEVMQRVIRRHISAPTVEVNTDLLAAARALCGHGAGIACILGTGSNSCFYDGVSIVKNVSPLGYILGDEGGGATLGRQLVSDLLKDMLPASLKESFLTRYDLTVPQIIDRVYRQPFPNRFLASFTPFIAEHIQEPEVYTLVFNGFTAFLCRNVMKYDCQRYPVSFVGSIAFYFREVLTAAAEATGIRIGTILQSPGDGLVDYHSK